MQGQQDNVVHKVAKREEAPTQQFDSARHSSKKVDPNAVADCRFCGFCHKKGKSFCPAYGKTCTKCGGRKLNDTIFDLPGVFAVADDVIVIARGVTHQNALIDHDAKLHKLHERCREKHIMLNDEKADMRKT